ncbi:hypothetical protein BVC71_02940 [Marivivens niveibacter]|uniref:Glycosyltransferase 2-like domain-containing protein n=1 Tax=Marivivens niveibacter TaxID=1930667 RepID=A0A251X164_9RHOB|nr:glycosyltransferase family 2 protein [Marivivens niveibacter]OUD10469.1 hypothetical protein BVC71_02940 [Marivivens niveibacter]
MTDLRSPTVSIVTPAYNAENVISQCYASIAAQTLTKWEWIVVDDGSIDRTKALVDAIMQSDPRVQFVSLDRNQGAAVARNRALEAVIGRYVAFLDADDYWYPEKLERQVNFMIRSGEVFTYSSYGVEDTSGIRVATYIPPTRTTYDELLKTNVIGCLTAMYDRAYFGHVQMPLLRKRQDYGLWLELLRNVDHAAAIPEVLAVYRKQKKSVSSNKLTAIPYTWAVYRKVAHLNICDSTFYLAHQLVSGLWARLHRRR